MSESTELVPHQDDTLTAETATHAQSAQAVALVQARFTLARRFPRDLDDVRVALLKECKRPGFAAVARYARPVGGGKVAEGPSIRFAEAAARHMGNMDAGVATLHDDADKRIVRVAAMDLETNAAFSKDLTIAKTGERRHLKSGQKPLGYRTNSFGDQVFIVRLEDSEIPVKENAEVSKVLRVLLLRLIPGWLLEECEAAIVRTLSDADAKDPDAARRALVDAFASVGVKAADLAAYLKHDLDGCSPAELVRLRAIFATIKDGETTWSEIVAAERGGEEAQKDPKAAELQKKVAEKVAAMKGKAQKTAGSAQPASNPATGSESGNQPEGRQPGDD